MGVVPFLCHTCLYRHYPIHCQILFLGHALRSDHPPDGQGPRNLFLAGRHRIHGLYRSPICHEGHRRILGNPIFPEDRCRILVAPNDLVTPCRQNTDLSRYNRFGPVDDRVCFASRLRCGQVRLFGRGHRVHALVTEWFLFKQTMLQSGINLTNNKHFYFTGLLQGKQFPLRASLEERIGIL